MAPSKLGKKRLAFAALAAVAPVVVACNSLIGLNDFEKGQCSAAMCTDDGAFPDVIIDGGFDVVQGDAQVDAKGADPVSWAKWPMPNYGDSGPRPPSLTLSGDFVTDNITQLTWKATIVPGDYNATTAVSACLGLPGGPWRVPKRIELVTLLDYSHATPFVDGSKFKDLLNYKVWTSSPVRPADPANPQQPYWIVNFDTGAVESQRGDLSGKVLCVRAK
jgi:hypothetical protein